MLGLGESMMRKMLYTSAASSGVIPAWYRSITVSHSAVSLYTSGSKSGVADPCEWAEVGGFWVGHNLR